jgi:hypothetical protein
MSRIRSIKPEWLDDELLSAASSEARAMSIALICLADDYGNGRAGRVWLAGRVFPGKTIETVDIALDELTRIRYVLLYEADGQRYFHVRNWDKHQRVDKPGAEKVPRPNLAELESSIENHRPSMALGNSQESPGISRELSASRDPLPSSSPISSSFQLSPDPESTGKSRSALVGGRAKVPSAKPDPKPFQMHDAWSPSEEYTAIQAGKYAVNIERVRALLPEFRYYWRNRGERKNQQNWEKTFASNVSRAAKSGDLFAEPTLVRSVAGRTNGRTTRAADLLPGQMQRIADLEAAEAAEEARQ